MTTTLATHREPMLDDPLDPTHAGNCHHYTKLHLAVGAAYAVLCGIELERIQKALKKTATRGSFEDWMKEHEAQLGFGPRHGFKYKAIADHVKSKLLVGRDADVMALLDRHPASLNEAEQKTLLGAVNKAVDGQSIRELLEEIGIARGERKCLTGPSPDRKPGTRSAPDTALIIQDELFGRIDKAGAVMEWWGKPIKLPGSKERVPLWQTMTEAQKAAMEKKLIATQRDVEHMLAQLREGRSRK